jgi:H+/Cl- antiporter ClcA
MMEDDDDEDEEAAYAFRGHLSDPTSATAQSQFVRHSHPHSHLNSPMFSQDGRGGGGRSPSQFHSAVLDMDKNITASLQGSAYLPDSTRDHPTTTTTNTGTVVLPPPLPPHPTTSANTPRTITSLPHDHPYYQQRDFNPAQFMNSEEYIDEQYYDEYSSEGGDDDDDSSTSVPCSENPWHWCLSFLYLKYFDPTPWLTRDLQFDEDTELPYFPDHAQWTLAGLVRHYLFNPISPEFTSLQQFCWAILIGIIMGIYTAVWKSLVELGVEFLWKSVPEFLKEHGVFTSVHGWFPLYHYMWIIPTIFGAILSYIFVVLPVKIPGQNEWIASLHKSGVQDYRTFWPLFILSTLGMLSGLSLGPELPLVLTAGMFGSWLGLICRQSMLQARILNLTAASAAIGGFFGFPMAGALFVLELPHRSGLQYFEALTPSTISSIVAVITNRLIVNNDVTGYFKYPFLATSLPSSIFWYAIVYGLYGCAIGTLYLLTVLWCKTWVHDWFHAPSHQDHDNHNPLAEEEEENKNSNDVTSLVKAKATDTVTTNSTERDALLQKKQVSSESTPKITKPNLLACMYSFGCVIFPKESHRAAVAGALAGFVCGWVAIFVPHTLFWGEAQLQNLIDKGRTPLPVFDDVTGDMVSLGYCIIDPSDPAAITAGFSVGCAALISISKTIVIGLSLGTGIIGGHFWGPLFVGCAASHFFTDVVKIIAKFIGFGGELASYPCLVIICTMGAAHVVSFRAHTAIMLILTLTISAFSPEDGNPYYAIAGDYSAVFPLLVISVSISMILSRDTFFYKEQRNRGDILAVPQVLCEPGMIGEPLVAAPFDSEDDSHDDLYDDVASVDSNHVSIANEGLVDSQAGVRSVPNDMTMEDIEESFRRTVAASQASYGSVADPYSVPPPAPGSSRASPLPPPAVRSSPTGSVRKTAGMPPMAPPLSPMGTALVPPPPMSTVNTHMLSSSPTGSLAQMSGIPPVATGVVPPPPISTVNAPALSSARLDELLSMPMDQGRPSPKPRKKSSDFHRRTNSLPNTFVEPGTKAAPATVTGPPVQPVIPNRSRAGSSSRQDMLVRVSSFGEVTDHAPSLLEQARIQAASSHRRVPSLTRGRSSRKNSATSASELGIDSGALSLEDYDQSFTNLVNSRNMGGQG